DPEHGSGRGARRVTELAVLVLRVAHPLEPGREVLLALLLALLLRGQHAATRRGGAVLRGALARGLVSLLLLPRKLRAPRLFLALEPLLFVALVLLLLAFASLLLLAPALFLLAPALLRELLLFRRRPSGPCPTLRPTTVGARRRPEPAHEDLA